jgi:peptide/nickel transport system permease protein
MARGTGRLREGAFGGGLWRDKAGLFGLLVLLALAGVGLLGPLLSQHDPGAMNLGARLRPPALLPGGSLAYPLGTDQLGRDVLSRILHGGRVSLAVGVTVVFATGLIGCALGLAAGYFRGRIDALVSGLTDIQVAFPGLLLALVVLAMIGPSPGGVIVVLIINGWMAFARLARAMTLSLRERAFVEGAIIIGCRPVRVVFRHILPNLTSPMLTLAVLEFARVILAEAALSYLGMGVQPPAASWGLDVAQGKSYIFRGWWLVTFPGLALAVTVLGVNLFAGWLQLITNPHEREKLLAQSRTAGGASSGA